MNKRQLEVQKISLKAEQAVIDELKKAYSIALDRVNEKIALLKVQKQTQSKIWRRDYQNALKKQIEAILKELNSNNYSTIERYLQECYENGFFGTLYDLQGQGIPLIFPINQEEVVLSIQKTPDSIKLSRRLYTDVEKLQKGVITHVSINIANGESWENLAMYLSNDFKMSYNNALRIARTEGHRVQQEATYHCQQKAKERGADVVKQWDSTLDGATRPDHVELDGQVREIDEPFEIKGMKAMYPGAFGVAKEDINCRCCLLQRARYELGSDDYKYLNSGSMTDSQLKPLADKLHLTVEQLRKYGNDVVPMKADSFDDFMKRYNAVWHYEGSDLQKTVETRMKK